MKIINLEKRRIFCSEKSIKKFLGLMYGRLKYLKFIIPVLPIILIPLQSYGIPVAIYGNIGGGIGIIESSIDGFYTKSMPVFSSGITFITQNSKRANLGLDLNISYSFKSDYNDYFYYGPFMEIGISPIIELSIFRFLSTGLFGTFAPTYTGYESSVDLKIGGYLSFSIRSRWLKGIILQYEHGFLDGYKTNEKITLKSKILIYKRH